MPSLDFSTNGIKPSAPLPTVPPGKYRAQIVGSEIKPSRRNPLNRFVELRLELLDSPYKGRHLIDRINCWNASVEAQSIARSQLVSIGHAVGVMPFSATEELHRRPLVITVKHDEQQKAVVAYYGKIETDSGKEVRHG